MNNYLKDDFIDEVKGCLGKEGDGSGQANVIESIKVNGVDQSVDSNKSVDIPVPTKTSDLDNDSSYMTEDQVNNKVTEGVASIVADAPEDFDTLKEMSDWLTQHDESAAAMNTSIKKNADDIAALQTSKADQEDVDWINSNLDNQGLINVFDNKYESGGISGDGSEWNNTNFLRSVNYFKCGKTVTIKCNKNHSQLVVTFYNESGNGLGNVVVTNVSNGIFNAPSGSTKFRIQVADENITSQTVGEVLVYIDNEISQLKNDLGDLAYGEKSANSNIIWNNPIIDCPYGVISKTDTGLSVTGVYYGVIELNSGKNKDYTIGYTKSGSGVNTVKVVNSTRDGDVCVFSNATGGTFNTGDNDVVYLYFYGGDGSSNTSIYSNLFLCEGTSGTYEPYTPSVKMLAEEVSAQNESLEQQGLLDKFDNQLEQGYYQTQDGQKIYHENFVRSANVFSCKPNDVIYLESNIVATSAMILYFKGNQFVSYSEDVLYGTSKGKAIVPNNVDGFVFHIYKDGGITPSKVSIKLYINNQIEQIKNDLSESKSKLDNISVDTIDRELGEITFKGIGFSAKLTLLKIGNQLELLRGQIHTVGNFFSVTSKDELSFDLSVSEFGDYINGLKMTSKLAFSRQGIFASKVIGVIYFGEYTSSNGDKGIKVMLSFNDSYEFSSANVRSGMVQFDF